MANLTGSDDIDHLQWRIRNASTLDTLRYLEWKLERTLVGHPMRPCEPEESRLPLTNITFFLSEPEFVGRMPVRREIPVS